MAVSERIKAEARRTIVGIQRYYEKYGSNADDAEEMEHRIARVEASMEGCNGLTHEEKVQKTAENVFELTCAMERSYDATRTEIKILREENAREFNELRGELQDGLKSVIDRIDSPHRSSAASGKKGDFHGLFKIISDHPGIFSFTFIVVLLIVLVSGHFDDIVKVCGG